MIRGVQRKMIVIRNIDGHLFDEAHFILKRSIKETERQKDELLREANRIICENSYSSRLSHRKKYTRAALIASFFAGFFTSLLISLAALFVIFG